MVLLGFDNEANGLGDIRIWILANAMISFEFDIANVLAGHSRMRWYHSDLTLMCWQDTRECDGITRI